MLSLNCIALVIIPILFAIIHCIEFTSYFSRVAGLQTGAKVLSYSYQQMFFVGTRFFFIALMPLIGFVVDGKVSLAIYLNMLHISMLLAGVGYFLAFIFRRKVIALIIFWLNKKNNDNIISNKKFFNENIKNILKYKKLIFLSSIVFCSYALGVFIAFYYALSFYEYRATISQLSGVVNGLATVLLTFIVEPLLAREIDRDNPDAINMLYAMLLGRFLGVAILTHIVIMVI